MSEILNALNFAAEKLQTAVQKLGPMPDVYATTYNKLIESGDVDKILNAGLIVEVFIQNGSWEL